MIVVHSSNLERLEGRASMVVTSAIIEYGNGILDGQERTSFFRSLQPHQEKLRRQLVDGHFIGEEAKRYAVGRIEEIYKT